MPFTQHHQLFTVRPLCFIILSLSVWYMCTTSFFFETFESKLEMSCARRPPKHFRILAEKKIFSYITQQNDQNQEICH